MMGLGLDMQSLSYFTNLFFQISVHYTQNAKHKMQKEGQRLQGKPGSVLFPKMMAEALQKHELS